MSTFVLAEFREPEGMLRAARLLRERGWGEVDTHSPFPVEGYEAALGLSRTRVALAVLVGGLAGVVIGYGVQWYCNAVSYPINVGGRPLNSWPTFIPITFETAVLLGGISAFLAALWLSGLPRLHHPLFQVEGFRRATIDRFWVSAALREVGAPEKRVVVEELQRLGADQVAIVEPEAR